MEELLKEILSEMKSQTAMMAAVLEQIQDLRVDFAKANCQEKQKEQIETIRKVFAGTPMAEVFDSMMSKMGAGGKHG